MKKRKKNTYSLINHERETVSKSEESATEISLTHVPVLLNEIIDFLLPMPISDSSWFVDCTLGLGGHTAAILEKDPIANVLAIDRDLEAINQAKVNLASYEDRVRFVHSDFKQLSKILIENNISSVSSILVDLGISSWQLGQSNRGFSFKIDGPLDMRMDRSSGYPASFLINTFSAAELADIFYYYGEEKMSRRIARFILKERELEPIQTTGKLAEIVRKALSKNRQQKIDPATRVFQALRIAVNKELNKLDDFISEAINYLVVGGRLGIISFHSLEDRIVKQTFREKSGKSMTEEETSARIKILTNKPVCASDNELNSNPRARSAKLRVCEKL